MSDVDDDIQEEVHGRGLGDSESDSDEIDLWKLDISSEEVRSGEENQGNVWESLNMTREKYRLIRSHQYQSYEDIPNSGKDAEKDCKPTNKGGTYYEFQQNRGTIKPTVLHFQLKNLVWATSKHDVYLLSDFSVVHWAVLTCTKSIILNVPGMLKPIEERPGSSRTTQVSTFAIKDKLLVVGGFQGELICKYIDRPGVSFSSRVTHDKNAVMNCIEIYRSPSGAVHFTASNNDCVVRDFDVENFQLSNHFHFPWPVKHTSLSPDGKLLVVVGGSPDGQLVDSQSGLNVGTLRGHLDYSFASAWHPDGRIFATGNQDKTCRLWDIRNLSKSVAVLKGNIGSIQSIRFTSDGQFMAMAESADFVHIYNVKSGYEKQQEIDLFGEIAGISFSPDTEALFIGNHGFWAHTYSSLLQYRRCRNYSYLDSLI